VEAKIVPPLVQTFAVALVRSTVRAEAQPRPPHRGTAGPFGLGPSVVGGPEPIGRASPSL